MLKNRINKLIKTVSWQKSLWWLGLLGLTIFLHFNHGLNGDEGVTLNGAWNLINGRRLYGNDFFEFIPPGSFYLLFGIWKIFGVSFLAAKTLAITLLFLGAIGLHETGKLIIKNRVIISLIPLTFIILSGWWWIINHNTFNLAFLIWSCYFFIRGLDNLKKSNFIASGLLAGIAILFLQQKGLALLGSICLFLIFLSFKKRQKEYLKSSLTLIIASLLPLLLLCFWPLKTIFYNLIEYPFFGYLAANRGSYSLLIVSLILWVLGLLTLTTIKEKSDKIWLLMVVQFCLLLTTYPLPDAYHVSQIIFPILLITFYLTSEFLKKYKQKITKNVLIIVLMTALWCMFLIDLVLNTPNFYSWEKNRNYELISYINSNCPGQYLYSGPFMPNLYFETKKLNVTPYSFLITQQQTPLQFIDALNNFKGRRPSCAVLVYPNSFARFRHNQNNILEKYIKENYGLIYQPLDYLFVYKNLKSN